MAVVGVTAEGVRLVSMDERSYRNMWTECVERILAAEEVMAKKGARGSRLRGALLARLLVGQPLDGAAARAALMHISND